MKKNFSINILIGFIGIFLASCGSESKKGLSIPAVPEVTEKARRTAAIEFLSDLLNSSSNSADIYYKRAKLYLEDERPKEALDIKANNGHYYQVKALILRELKEPQQALEAASKAEVLNVESPELFTLLGDLYQQIGQYGKAKLYLNKSLQISPNNGETYFFRGEIAAKQADTATALQLYHQTLNLKPTFLPLYIKFAEVYTALRQYDLALFYTDEGIKHHPKNADLYFKKGITYQRAFQTDSALASYSKAVKLDSSLIQASFSAGYLYFKIRAFRQALPQFAHTLKINPQYPDAKLYLALCLEYTGDFAKAEQYYSEIVAETPQDYRAVNGMWRAKRKQQFDNYLPEDFEMKYDTSSRNKYETPHRNIDTTFRQLQPKTRLNLKPDSSRKN